MDPIRSDLTGFREIHRSTPSGGSSGPSFKDTLKAFYQGVNKEMNQADRMAAEFAVGERQGLHEIMIASEKAGISFKLLLEIRNKLLDAYQEVMRMSF